MSLPGAGGGRTETLCSRREEGCALHPRGLALPGLDGGARGGLGGECTPCSPGHSLPARASCPPRGVRPAQGAARRARPGSCGGPGPALTFQGFRAGGTWGGARPSSCLAPALTGATLRPFWGRRALEGGSLPRPGCGLEPPAWCGAGEPASRGGLNGAPAPTPRDGDSLLSPESRGPGGSGGDRAPQEDASPAAWPAVPSGVLRGKLRASPGPPGPPGA